MNEGMKIILERLKTNPEEFESLDNPFATESKWTALIHKYERNLPAEDVKAFKDAIDVIRQEEFTANVMKELLAPEEDNSLGKPWYTQQGNITLSAGQTLGMSLNSGVVTGAGTITYNDQLAHELTHVKALIELQKQKKHKTLFGKLFNYS
jgi:hypothetical protein